MAKKKKDTPKKVVANEVVEENIVDLMKEVSMQEEVDTIVEETIMKDNDATSQEQNNVEQVNDNSDITEKYIDNEDSIEESITDKLDNLEKICEIEEKIDSIINNVSVDEIIEDVKNNNDTKPRMTYKQMMGYDWNGQNFDYV